MRSTFVIVIAALAASLAALAAQAALPPALTLAARQPLEVTGAHFHARELVRVVATSGGVWTVRVRADARGRFVADFPALTVDRCLGLQVRAAGSGGSVAALKLPLPACLPARNP